MAETTIQVAPQGSVPDALGILLSIEKMRGDTVAQLARIEERQVALVKADENAQKAADHRHGNVMQAISAFVPRSEIEKDNKAIHERIAALEGRVSTVEKKLWGALVGVVAAFGGTFLSIFGVHVKT